MHDNNNFGFLRKNKKSRLISIIYFVINISTATAIFSSYKLDYKKDQ